MGGCVYSFSGIYVSTNYLVSTAIPFDRRSTPVLRTLEDAKISKANLALSNLGFSNLDNRGSVSYCILDDPNLT